MTKHIAYIVHSLDPGGTERLALEMGKTFSREYTLSIICLDTPGQWAAEARAFGVPVHCLFRSPGIDLTLPVKLARFAKAQGVDLFHAHQCTPWFYAGLSRLILSTPKLLLEEHGRHYPEVKGVKRIAFNRFFLQHLTTAVTAVSKDIRDRLIAFEGIGSGKIEVIYNGSGQAPPYTAAEAAAVRDDLGFGPDDLIMGTVGRLDPIKNLPLFLEGLARAKETCPRLKGLIIGDGPMMGEITKQVSESGLDSRVVLTGFRPDAARLVRIMDLFCLVSFSEGTSMALLEAMAAGIPAIVTDVGGNPEIVLDRHTGWVVPSDDEKAFSEALETATKDPAMRRELGTNAQQRFESEFSFDAMIGNYRHLYHRILGG